MAHLEAIERDYWLKASMDPKTCQAARATAISYQMILNGRIQRHTHQVRGMDRACYCSDCACRSLQRRSPYHRRLESFRGIPYHRCNVCKNVRRQTSYTRSSAWV